MGLAFDTACKELHDRGQPQIVYEIIARRIIEAAKNGERDPTELTRAGLAALGLQAGKVSNEAAPAAGAPAGTYPHGN